MIGKVDYAEDIQSLQQLRQLRADTREAFRFGKQRVEDIRPHNALLALYSALAMIAARHYMAPMHSDPELKRLSWRAHHRGTFEADLLVGGFFDAHHASWNEQDRALFSQLLEEQDVDILGWANGTASAPERYQGPMLEALKKLDYIPVER